MILLWKNKRWFNLHFEQEIVRLLKLDNSLRDLPSELGPQEILQKLKDKIEKNLTAKLDNPPEYDETGKVIWLVGGGLFHEFEWMPDSYESFLNDCW